MSIQRQIAFWLSGLAGLGLLLHLLGGVVTPFALGIVLGYLLDPIVRKLSSFGISRLGALDYHSHCLCRHSCRVLRHPGADPRERACRVH